MLLIVPKITTYTEKFLKIIRKQGIKMVHYKISNTNHEGHFKIFTQFHLPKNTGQIKRMQPYSDREVKQSNAYLEKLI